jgi:hypothetical protein
MPEDKRPSSADIEPDYTALGIREALRAEDPYTAVDGSPHVTRAVLEDALELLLSLVAKDHPEKAERIQSGFEGKGNGNIVSGLKLIAIRAALKPGKRGRPSKTRKPKEKRPSGRPRSAHILADNQLAEMREAGAYALWKRGEPDSDLAAFRALALAVNERLPPNLRLSEEQVEKFAKDTARRLERLRAAVPKPPEKSG